MFQSLDIGLELRKLIFLLHCSKSLKCDNIYKYRPVNVLCSPTLSQDTGVVVRVRTPPHRTL